VKTIDITDVDVLALRLPGFVPRRYRPHGSGNWSGHMAFASDLIQAIQPKLLVELGTHWGESYFGFCQTIAENGIHCACYAVDHWRGEQHSGNYGEEVYEEVREYNERLYMDFSYLLRHDFSEALQQFSDASIDLLHIDGLHTYEAVNRDFWSWLPKVKPGGIILLHDICARHADFGIWHLWEEIKDRFAETFEFRHSWGLGVVRNSGGDEGPLFTQALFRSTAAVQELIRRQYALYASHLENLLLRSSALAHQVNDDSTYGTAAPVRIRMIIPGRDGSAEPGSDERRVQPGQWSTLSFELAEDPKTAMPGLQPSDRPSLVEIRDLSLYSATGVLLARLDGTAVAPVLLLCGTLASLNDSRRCLLLSYGDEPRIDLLPFHYRPEPVRRMEITLRIDLLDAVTPAVAAFVQSAGAGVASELRGRLNALQAQQAATDFRAMTAERDSLRARLRQAEELQKSLEDQLAEERAVREGIVHSKSWRLTEPLRRIMAALRP